MDIVAYRPRSNRERVTASAVIGAVHVGVAVALVSLGGIVQVVQQARPLMVRMVPATVAYAKPTNTLPPPKLRVPEIALPSPPATENLFTVRMEERVAPASALVPVAAVVPTAPATPSLEPPRFDLAYLNNPAPSYPALSRRTGEQGRVMLRVRVDAAGQVEAIELHRTSGFSRLDEAAMTAVRRWKFVPARSGDRTVSGYALVPVVFELHG